MQAPGSSEGFSLPPRPPKRRRRQRTVYSVEQREELETYFQNNQYPSYEERETLAARLHLQEHQVQVWFKNRRAKQTRLRGGSRTRQRSTNASASSQGPGICAPVLAALCPRLPEDPVLPSGPECAEDPAFPWDLFFAEDPVSSGGSALPGDAGSHNPFGGVAAAETSASSHLQTRSGPAQDAQNPVPAAPASAPAPAPAPEVVPVSNAGDFRLDLLDLLNL